MKKKIIIGMLLSSGLLVIAAAIIRAQLSLGTEPVAANINSWGVRETFVAVLTVNAPILRPLFRRAFWTWGRYNPAPSRNKVVQGSSGHPHTESGMHAAPRVVGGMNNDIEMGLPRHTGDDQIVKGSHVEWSYHVKAEEDEDKLIAKMSRDSL
ncbi:hypothetical protein ANO11243_092870 [Dothideomycetidae sp. 11243]|nr:hypothetical protein ANO11243_092870 [fungal sp. No.11243]